MGVGGEVVKRELMSGSVVVFVILDSSSILPLVVVKCVGLVCVCVCVPWEEDKKLEMSDVGLLLHQPTVYTHSDPSARGQTRRWPSLGKKARVLSPVMGGMHT